MHRKDIEGVCVFKGFDNPPYTHNLMMLAEKSGLLGQLNEEQMDFLDFLQPLNIEARYPEAKQKLLSVLTEKRCKEIIDARKLY